jgi:hypothetical protein
MAGSVGGVLVSLYKSIRNDTSNTTDSSNNRTCNSADKSSFQDHSRLVMLLAVGHLSRLLTQSSHCEELSKPLPQLPHGCSFCEEMLLEAATLASDLLYPVQMVSEYFSACPTLGLARLRDALVRRPLPGDEDALEVHDALSHFGFPAEGRAVLVRSATGLLQRLPCPHLRRSIADNLRRRHALPTDISGMTAALTQDQPLARAAKLFFAAGHYDALLSILDVLLFRVAHATRQRGDDLFAGLTVSPGAPVDSWTRRPAPGTYNLPYRKLTHSLTHSL